MIRHGGLVALRQDGTWQGALIEGLSGSGKSDLALRALQDGLRLISDDRTLVWACGERVYGRAPETLRDLMEVRSVDVIREPSLPLAQVVVVIRCVSEPRAAPRLHDGEVEMICDLPLPVVELWPFELSAVTKLRRSITRVGLSRQGAYQAARAAHKKP
jgi:serine kinase of HPr protein (carbohydrate metabolism regulator)